MTTSVQPLTTSRTTWAIDPAHSLVEFSAKHMMITTVKGRFGGLAGTVTLDDRHPERSAVAVRIEADSIDTREPQRDAHLRSADFLDVERAGAIAFESDRIEGTFANPGDRFRVAGRLTIRDTTRDVTLDTTFEGRARDPWGAERVSFSATTTIDRRDFGLTWNQALELGGLLVGNEIRIVLEVQAVRSA